MKKDFWMGCRDQMFQMFQKFKEGIEFGQNLAKLSPPKVFKHSEMAHFYVKLAKMKIGCPIRHLQVVMEYLITLKSECLLVPEFSQQFFNHINEWIGKLYLCNSSACDTNCQCKIDFFNEMYQFAVFRNLLFK